jgi:hypothetical protein
MSFTNYYDATYGTGTSLPKMAIFVYANTSSEDGVGDKGSVVTKPIKNACDELLNYGSTGKYVLYKYTKSDFPGLTQSEIGSGAFRDWLDASDGNGNTTGENLLKYKGAHLLVHDYGCTKNLAGGEYADDCSAPDAFQTGVPAWTSIGCSPDLQDNSAIQECIHMFIRYKQDKVTDLTNDPNENTYREHRLGKVRIGYDATPMLTYHSDESDLVHHGDCRTNYSQSSYTQVLTECTKKAVKFTAQNNC